MRSSSLQVAHPRVRAFHLFAVAGWSFTRANPTPGSTRGSAGPGFYICHGALAGVEHVRPEPAVSNVISRRSNLADGKRASGSFRDDELGYFEQYRKERYAGATERVWGGGGGRALVMEGAARTPAGSGASGNAARLVVAWCATEPSGSPKNGHHRRQREAAKRGPVVFDTCRLTARCGRRPKKDARNKRPRRTESAVMRRLVRRCRGLGTGYCRAGSPVQIALYRILFARGFVHG